MGVDENPSIDQIEKLWAKGYAMKKASRFLFVAALGFYFSCSATTPLHAEGIVWREVAKAAQGESRQLSRPLLIYVGADFCGYCRLLEEKTWSDDSVVRIIKTDFVPLHLDGDRDSRLVDRLGVRGFPAVMVLSPAGKLVARFEGYRSPAAMKTFLSQNTLVQRSAQLLP